MSVSTPTHSSILDAPDPCMIFDDYLLSIEDLAPELQNIFGELTRKNKQTRVLKDEFEKENRVWDNFEKIYGRLTPYPDEDAVLSRVQRIKDRISDLSDEKIRIADQAVHLIDAHIKRLDQDLAMFTLPNQSESIPSSPDVSGITLTEPEPIIYMPTPPPAAAPASPPVYGGMVGAFMPPPERMASPSIVYPQQLSVMKKAMKKEALTPSAGGGGTVKKRKRPVDKIVKRSNSSLRFSFTPEPENIAPSGPSPIGQLPILKDPRQTQLSFQPEIVEAQNEVVENEEDAKLYCLCQTVSHGEMIACDNEVRLPYRMVSLALCGIDTSPCWTVVLHRMSERDEVKTQV
ncbi:hypothetical protein SmJEL517_g02162 [Synchytrium microbalum]|uniref:Inhibitor of growth protein N-terminal histone-binding domain-containing protein n=1 Tax=Synchytrium microbalum TaxID=1806994 RepID=A0A507C7U9_9FUNG|nr:uncharacterized protein SmJEL517_g02162 [Synchytrium microbalum]TPX35581.1 hypothetical protein SmJEL517_g02162 [Synchytrium microbalum]